MNAHLLLWGGVIGGPLFIAIFLIEGALRPGYNAMVQPVSALSQGSRGWIQQFNFFSSFVLLFAASYGIYFAEPHFAYSFWAPFLIRIYALGLFGAGLFVTDSAPLPALGEPARTKTRAGRLHDLFSLVVFVSLFIDTFVFARLFWHIGATLWAVYSAVTGVLYGAGFLIFARGFARPGPLHQVAGFLQRITIAIGAFWLMFVCMYLLIASA